MSEVNVPKEDLFVLAVEMNQIQGEGVEKEEFAAMDEEELLDWIEDVCDANVGDDYTDKGWDTLRALGLWVDDPEDEPAEDYPEDDPEDEPAEDEPTTEKEEKKAPKKKAKAEKKPAPKKEKKEKKEKKVKAEKKEKKATKKSIVIEMISKKGGATLMEIVDEVDRVLGKDDANKATVRQWLTPSKLGYHISRNAETEKYTIGGKLTDEEKKTPKKKAKAEKKEKKAAPEKKEKKAKAEKKPAPKKEKKAAPEKKEKKTNTGKKSKKIASKKKSA